jgi:hypothetical protein
VESKLTLHSDCGKGLMQEQRLFHLVPACFSEERLPGHAGGCRSDLQACCTCLSRRAPAQHTPRLRIAQDRTKATDPDLHPRLYVAEIQTPLTFSAARRATALNWSLLRRLAAYSGSSRLPTYLPSAYGRNPNRSQK